MNSASRHHGLFSRFKIAYYKFISDRRRYLRSPLRIKVTNRGTGLFEFYSSTNISAGGMFLKADSPSVPGTMLKLEFSLTGRDEAIIAEGKVVRTAPQTHEFDAGMGVQFTQISEGDRKAIQSFVDEIKSK